jgi:hypothetical protein
MDVYFQESLIPVLAIAPLASGSVRKISHCTAPNLSILQSRCGAIFSLLRAVRFSVARILQEFSGKLPYIPEISPRRILTSPGKFFILQGVKIILRGHLWGTVRGQMFRFQFSRPPYNSQDTMYKLFCSISFSILLSEPKPLRTHITPHPVRCTINTSLIDF